MTQPNSANTASSSPLNAKREPTTQNLNPKGPWHILRAQRVSHTPARQSHRGSQSVEAQPLADCTLCTSSTNEIALPLELSSAQDQHMPCQHRIPALHMTSSKLTREYRSQSTSSCFSSHSAPYPLRLGQHNPSKRDKPRNKRGTLEPPVPRALSQQAG